MNFNPLAAVCKFEEKFSILCNRNAIGQTFRLGFWIVQFYFGSHNIFLYKPWVLIKLGLKITLKERKSLKECLGYTGTIFLL